MLVGRENGCISYKIEDLLGENEVVRFENEVVVLELSWEMSMDDHMIKIVSENVQGGPYDRFQKIIHVLVLQKHSLLEFKNKRGSFDFFLFSFQRIG